MRCFQQGQDSLKTQPYRLPPSLALASPVGRLLVLWPACVTVRHLPLQLTGVCLRQLCAHAHPCRVTRIMELLKDFMLLFFSFPVWRRLPPAPSQAPGKIMWNTSNSKVILRWDQVHALENESEVTGYKVKMDSFTLLQWRVLKVKGLRL